MATFSNPKLVIAVDLVQKFLLQWELNTPVGGEVVALFGPGAEEILSAFASGDFRVIPDMELVSSSQLNGALGAFSVSTNRIYLSREFVEGSEVEAIARVLLEEIGHTIDPMVNAVDTPGDEGAIFAALVMGESLSEVELATLKAENDHGFINLNGENITVEMANFTGGSENNNFVGTAQDDQSYPGTGADTIIGGGWVDYLQINNSTDTANTTVNYSDFNNGTITGGLNNGTTIQEVER